MYPFASVSTRWCFTSGGDCRRICRGLLCVARPNDARHSGGRTVGTHECEIERAIMPLLSGIFITMSVQAVVNAVSPKWPLSELINVGVSNRVVNTHVSENNDDVNWIRLISKYRPIGLGLLLSI